MDLKNADWEVIELEQKMDLMQQELEKKKVVASELRRDLRITIGTGHIARETALDCPGRIFTFKPQAEYWNQTAYQDILKGARGHMLVVLDSPNSDDKVHVLNVGGSLYLTLSDGFANDSTGDFE